jgi:glycosyltransferase involved in cell wall biosynthesis
VLAALPHNGEYIVVDDGSTDSTADILTEYSQSLGVLRQGNGGEASAVNAGVQRARGRYVCIVNADDLISKDLLHESIAHLDRSPSIAVTYCDWERIDSEGQVIETVTVPEYSFHALFAEFRCLPGPGAVVRLDALNGKPLRDVRYKFLSDYDAWLRLAFQGSFVRLPFVGAYWREHDQSASISGDLRRMAHERTIVIPNVIAREDTARLEVSPGLVGEAQANALYNAALLGLRDQSINTRRLAVHAWRQRREVPSTATWFNFLALLLYPLPSMSYSLLAHVGFRVSRGGRFGFRLTRMYPHG